MSHKIKNTTGNDIVIGQTTIQAGAIVELTAIPLEDGETFGKLICHIDNNDFEVYDHDNILIDTVVVDSFDKEVEGVVIETVTNNIRVDVLEVNKYVNRLFNA